MSEPRKLIALAVKIIEADRELARYSFSDPNGRITNVDDRRVIRDYDRFLKPARLYLGRMKR